MNRPERGPFTEMVDSAPAKYFSAHCPWSLLENRGRHQHQALEPATIRFQTRLSAAPSTGWVDFAAWEIRRASADEPHIARFLCT